jgi:flagellar biosynthetic protein FliP
MVIALTSFTRTIIVLSMLRHALCMQETPPNTVLVTLALFVTLFTMSRRCR